MRRAEHSDLRFALTLPEGWEADELPNGIVTVGTPPADGFTPPAGFAVTVEELDGEWGPAEIAEQGLLEQAHYLTDLRLLDEEEVELCGLPAHRTLATYRQGTSSLTIEQWHMVRDGRVLVLAGLGPTVQYVVLHDVWHAMVDSLELDGD